MKNIQRPVQVFVIGGAKVSSQTTHLPLPDKPSIAVLPFQNMSGDPEQEYFVDGLVEDIITALSRFKSLFVIARNSSLAYKGKSPDMRQVGRELGVRYVMEGSVRKAGSRLRITGQLIEADTGTHVWSERYDGELQDVFDLQDLITSSVAGTLEPTLHEVEIARVQRALDLVERGLRADRRDPMMLGTAGHCYAWFAHDLVKAAVFIDEAIEINPNYAHAYLQSGIVRTRLGDFPKAVAHLERAFRLSPRDARAYAFFQAMALALLLAGKAESARDWALRGVQHNPNYSSGWYVLAGSAAVLGHEAEAQNAARRLLALDPTFSISNYVRRYPARGPDLLQPLLQRLRLAGLPE